MTFRHSSRFLTASAGGLFLASVLVGMSATLASCDKDVSSTKSTTTKKTETPEGTKTTTEKNEKTVETEHKNPPPR